MAIKPHAARSHAASCQKSHSRLQLAVFPSTSCSEPQVIQRSWFQLLVARGTMYWDQEKTKCLIEDYRESRVLWDLCYSSYKDNRKKFKVWKELSKKYECSIKDLKDKIKNLRTTFHRKRKQKSGSGRTEPWVYFESLTFLLDVDVPKQSVSTDKNFDEVGFNFK